MPVSDGPVFVTGGTGFIGAELIKELVRNGREVHALVRSVDKAKSILPDIDATWHAGDLDDTEVIATAMAHCSEAYHLAGFAKLWHRDMSMFYRVNVQGLRNILEGASKAGLRRVVYTSTAGALGPSGQQMVTETSPRQAQPTTEYERSKVESEKQIPEFLDKGLEIVTVNPTRVFGPGQLNQSNSVTILIRDYIAGKWKFIPGDGTGIGNYVYVKDVVQGHLKAMEFGHSAERYILGGDNLSYNELFDQIGHVSGIRHKLYKVPLGVMMTLAKVQQLKANVFKSEPLITPGFVKKYTFDWKTDQTKARQDLHYDKTDFDDALQQTISWLRSH